MVVPPALQVGTHCVRQQCEERMRHLRRPTLTGGIGAKTDADGFSSGGASRLFGQVAGACVAARKTPAGSRGSSPPPQTPYGLVGLSRLPKRWRWPA